MSRWFRWYEGTCEDGKFRVVARNASVTVRDVIALWTFILEDAANANHRGVCQRNEDFMAAVLDFDDGQVEKLLGEMEAVGLVSVGHGAITVCNWGKRQFESDPSDPTNADRQKRFREKRKRNGNVTDAVTPDTERTDTEKKERDIGGGGEPTKDLSLRTQSHKISDECYSVLSIEPNAIPPDWYGLPYQIEMMLARGYDPPIIVATFAKLAGQKPLKPMNYFVKAVESAQQNQMKPAEKMNGSAAVRSDKSAIAALDRLGDAFAAYGLCEETGQAPVVQLPARRLR